MMKEIKIFLFVLSVLYLIRFILEFGFRLLQENPEPMKSSKVEKVSQLLSAAYAITYFLI